MSISQKNLIQLNFPSQYLCQVALGDQEGVLQVFSVKKNNDVSQVFKTLPGKEISRMELGGALGTVKDKIFTAAASEVRGHTKKGKLFLSFDTGMTEPIRSMSITGNDLLVAGAHVYSHFRDCRDAGRYLSEDVVSDVLALPGEKVPQLTPVLACGDRSLKVLRESSVAFGAELPGPPTALQLFYNDGGEKGDEVLYGTEDGKVKIYTGMGSMNTKNILFTRWDWCSSPARALTPSGCWRGRGSTPPSSALTTLTSPETASGISSSEGDSKKGKI